MFAQEPGNSTTSLLDWLIEFWTKQWPTVNEVEMLVFSWHTLEQWFSKSSP